MAEKKPVVWDSTLSISQQIQSGDTIAFSWLSSKPTTLSGYGITDGQPLDATLTALAGLSVSNNQGIYATGADAFSTYSLTAGGRALSGVTGTANTFPYFSSLNTTSMASITSAGLAILDDADASTQLTTLGGTTVGKNIFTASNPGAISYIQILADNTVSLLSGSSFRTAIGAGTGNGTVTSVGLALPSIFSVSGSPVATSGTLTGSLVSQSANLVFASPDGSSGTPTFRALVAADVPTLNQNTTGSAATWTTGRTVSLTGDVTGTSGTFNGSADLSFAATIANNAVTLAKLATSPTARLLGRASSGAGSVEALDVSTAKTMLLLDLVENTALSTWAGTSNITTLGTIGTGTWQGSVIGPAYLGTGTRDGTKFLRDDGTWQAGGGGGGGVTSVGLALPSIFSVSGSPVISSGTLTGSLVSQSANLVFASPDGSAGTPIFRALVAADVPNLNWAKITSGKPTTLSGYGITDAVDTVNNQTIGGLKQFTGTGGIVANNSGGAQIIAASASGSESKINLRSGVLASTTRWELTKNTTSEIGSNAGSDLDLNRFADGGTLIGNVFQVLRSTGVLDFKVAPTILGSSVAVTGTTANTFLTLDATISEPAAPSTGNVVLFGRQLANRNMVAIKGPSGISSILQPILARNKIGYWCPPGNATTVPGVLGFTAPTITGFTATARNVATTNVFTRMRRLGYVTGTTAGTVGHWRLNVYQYTTGGTGLGGFTYVIRFGISDATLETAARMFIGMRSSATPSNVDPGTLTNCFGIGHNASDTNLSFYSGGSSAQTPVGLGSNFPVAKDTAYELALFAPPNETKVYWQVTNLHTNNTTGGNISGGATILPQESTLVAPWGFRTNNTAAVAVAIDVMSAYIETDS